VIEGWRDEVDVYGSGEFFVFSFLNEVRKEEMNTNGWSASIIAVSPPSFPIKGDKSENRSEWSPLIGGVMLLYP